jgi:hypothetical protein
VSFDRTPFLEAWERAMKAPRGSLSENLVRELGDLPPELLASRGWDRLWLRERVLNFRAERLARTGNCSHDGSAEKCERCGWLAPWWCVLVALCSPEEPWPREVEYREPSEREREVFWNQRRGRVVRRVVRRARRHAAKRRRDRARRVRLAATGAGAGTWTFPP